MTNYGTESGFEAYCAARAYKVADGDIAAALIRASVWLDGRYRSSFPGQRTNGRAQALEWPRINAYDRSGEDIASDEIPAEIEHATYEATLRELASPGSLSPDVTPGQIEKRIKVEGIEFEYSIGSGSVADQRPVSTLIDDILSSLLTISRGPALFGTAVRA